MMAAIMFFLSAALFLDAESIGDDVVATIRLAKTTETVFLSQLKKQIDAAETAYTKGQALPTDQRKLILDQMIMRILYVQAAERDKVVVTQDQLKSSIDAFKSQLLRSAGINREVTEPEWQTLVKSNTGMAYEDWLKQFKNSVVLPQVYIMQKRGQEISGIASPTDAEVQEFYEANRSQFLRHDMVSLSHIFVDTSKLTNKEDRDKASRRADDISRELRAGGSFKDLVLKYSDDTGTKYKDGKIGWVDRENAQQRQVLGSDLYNAVFKMKPGDVSGVLASPSGYHIIRVDDRVDVKILNLDEPTLPDSKATVREYIRGSLLGQRQQTALAAAMQDLGDSLRKEAENAGGIKIFQEKLPW
jgi:parvulin-like peptidyl-prolyl isomerase